MIDVQKVDFVSVPTRNAQAARRFYGEILGLPPSPHNPDEFETPDCNVLILHPLLADRRMIVSRRAGTARLRRS